MASEHAQTRADVPDSLGDQAEAAAALLRALANPNRLQILCTLAVGEHSVGRLNEAVPLSPSALSQHLAVLRKRGLVRTRRQAQTIHYSLEEGPALDIIRILHRDYCATRKGGR